MTVEIFGVITFEKKNHAIGLDNKENKLVSWNKVRCTHWREHRAIESVWLPQNGWLPKSCAQTEEG
jgi:hypothetical protein